MTIVPHSYLASALQTAAALVLLLWAPLPGAAQNAPPVPVTTALPLFVQHCANCHDSKASSRAPSREGLRSFAPEAIYRALTTGPMAVNAGALNDGQKRAMAVYLSGRPFGATDAGQAAVMPNRCASTPIGNPLTGTGWNGWGVDLGNSRFQPEPGLTADQLPQLTVKWAFGFPQAASAYGQPAVMGGRVYAGSDAGFVYALSAQTGCVYWSYQAKAGVRTATTIGPLKKGSGQYAVYFADAAANVYAVNAATGELLWSHKPEPHPLARITGSPVLHNGRLYVPMSSGEESAGGQPTYECCTFRGSLIAYDAVTGKLLWQSYTIPTPPQPTRKTSRGTQLYGPSGAAIWSAPTIDVKRGLIYVATGDGYSDPGEGSTDAIIAFDLKTGARRWVQQVLAGDVWLTGCVGNNPNKSETCPKNMGPDFDFGGNPVLRTLPNGKDIIIAGQKSGIAWAFDPDRQGEILWQQRVGQGSSIGGVQFGPATDGRYGFFANTDSFAGREAGGLTALDLGTGQKIWSTRATCPPDPAPCLIAQPAAVSAIPGVVFSGTIDGVMRAYSAADGTIIWEYNSAREYTTVNGVPARGGSLNGPGPVIANGMFFMNSGYSAIGGTGPGNVLLAFGID